MRFTARLYQHAFDCGDDLEWDDLKSWNDQTLYRTLLISLPIYQNNTPPRINYIIESMICDLNGWIHGDQNPTDMFLNSDIVI